jgi:hypothetical protein
MSEIFDRSVAIYVRHFKVFAAIMLTLLVPAGIVRYFAIPDQQTLAHMLTQTSSPGAFPPGFAGLLTGLGILFAVLLVVSPFVHGAVVVGVAAATRGEAPTYAGCFRVVLARWAPLLGTLLVNLLVFSGMYILGVIVLGVLFGIGSALVTPALPLAVIAFMLGGIAAIAYFGVLLAVAVAWVFAIFACNVEQVGPIEAVSRSYTRVFARSEIGRVLVLTLALCVLQLGVVVASALAIVVTQLVTKSYLAVIAVDTIVTACFAAFFPLVLAVYYFDVRKRSEALDIEAALAGHADAIAGITANEPVYAATAYVSGEERAIIKYFLERRVTLGAERRASLAAQIANRVRDRVPVDMRTLENESLLERL